MGRLVEEQIEGNGNIGVGSWEPELVFVGTSEKPVERVAVRSEGRRGG
jgi:hypothetical protein